MLCASGLYLRGADNDECCEETPLEGVLELELGSEVWSVSIIGGFGLLEGLGCLVDIAEGERLEGKDEREVLRLRPAEPLEIVVVRVSVASTAPLVVGRCMAMAILVSFVLWYMAGRGIDEAMVLRRLAYGLTASVRPRNRARRVTVSYAADPRLLLNPEDSCRSGYIDINTLNNALLTYKAKDARVDGHGCHLKTYGASHTEGVDSRKGLKGCISSGSGHGEVGFRGQLSPQWGIQGVIFSWCASTNGGR